MSNVIIFVELDNFFLSLAWCKLKISLKFNINMLDIIKNNLGLFFVIFIAVVAPQFFVGGLKVILFIVLGIIALLFILGIVFRVKIVNMQKQMQDQMKNGGAQNFGGFNPNGNNSQTNTTDEGDVKIFTQQGVNEKRVSNNVGDYVDFEEVEEQK